VKFATVQVEKIATIAMDMAKATALLVTVKEHMMMKSVLTVVEVVKSLVNIVMVKEVENVIRVMVKEPENVVSVVEMVASNVKDVTEIEM
jgi:hypothetical protein